MLRDYFDISESKQSDESGKEIRRLARDAYFAERKRQREGEALLNSVDFDAAILVWQHQVNLEIRLSNKRNINEGALGLTEKEQNELHNWKLQAIYDQGGALNWPGFYYPNPQILHLIERKLKELC